MYDPYNNNIYDPTDIDDIDMDQLVQSAGLTGEISSYRHGDEEVLHALLLEETFDIADIPYLPNSEEDPSSFRYTAADGSERVRYVKSLENWSRSEDNYVVKFALWQDYTDYDGEVVPLEVLRQMREVQGASEAQWIGRGIEVGDAAWQVLLDWKAEPKVERSEDSPLLTRYKEKQARKREKQK